MRHKVPCLALEIACVVVATGLGACSFDLPQPKIAELRIAKGDVWADTLAVGELATFHAKITDETGSDVVAPIAWGTTDSTIVGIAAGQSVSGASDQEQQASGMWGVISPKAPGSADIVASLERPGARKTEFRARIVVKDVSTTLTVSKIDTVAIGIDHAVAELLNGTTVTWETTDPSVAQIAAVTGSPYRVQVTPRSAGTAIISATVSGSRLRPIVMERPIRVATMQVTERSPWRKDLTVTDTIALAVDVRDASGKVIPLTRVRWASTNPLAVSLDTTGRLIALGRGGAEVVASVGESGFQVTEYRSTITVHPLRLVPAPQWPTVLTMSNTARVTVVVRDATDSVRTGIPIQWRSSNEAAFAVDSDGTVRALSKGGGEIIASVGGTPFEVSDVRGTMAVTEKWSTVDAGHAHTCAISASNQVGYCWGGNKFGEIGTGRVGGSYLRPTRIATVMPFDELEAGGFPTTPGGTFPYTTEQAHTCGRGGSVVVCWGWNATGQLGSGEAVCDAARAADGHCGHSTPVGVAAPYGTGAEAMAVGGRTACLAFTGAPTEIDCWGMATFGTDVRFGASPTQILSVGHSITAGGLHVCGWPIVACAGVNTYGQLGIGSTTSLSKAAPLVQTAAGPLSLTKPLSAGGSHTCAADMSANVWCWGLNSSGQLGATSSDLCSGLACSMWAIRAQFSLSVKSISAGYAHTCVVALSGDAYCWGDNSSGQLGRGTVGGFTSTAGIVSGGLHFATISAGESHTCAVTVDGAIYCWGSNASGQLGDGTSTSQSTPVRVVDPPT